MRVFNLGLPKSGTTTLARALRRAGLHVADHRIKEQQTENPALKGAYLAEVIYRGYFRTGDPLRELEEFQGFAEVSMLRGEMSLWPQMDFALIEAIRARHPETVFVASWRAPQDISDSMLRWNDLGSERLPAASVPGLPHGFGETTKERVRWIEGHYAALERHFAGDEAFLLYDTAGPHAVEVLSGHLGLALPWWGQANRNRANRNRANRDAPHPSETAA